MTVTDRLITEQAFHDRQAAERAEAFRAGRATLAFADEAFLDHETWIRPAWAKLGSLAGKTVLDYGCGHAMAAIVMARAGAVVRAFDLSPGYVTEAQKRAAANRVHVQCVVADGHQLPFPDACFDAIWGNAILHHLDLFQAGAELHRVLKPGGVAVFCEPWGGNPLLSFARRKVHYPGKAHTPDEQPLQQRDLAPLRAIFPNLQLERYQLLGMIRRLGCHPRLCRWLDSLDHVALRTLPKLQNWCRYAVISWRRPA